MAVDKQWVIWQGVKPWKWALVVRKHIRPRWRVYWSVSAVPGNKFLMPPRFHAYVRFGPFAFQRHNAGVALGFGRYELTTHW